MSLRVLLFGKPIPKHDAERESIGPLAGIPVLGLDALASASYGPEAALTVFLLAGVSGLAHIGPVMLVVCAVMLIVQFSYRQTIAGYPNGGGSFTVAKENLGMGAGLWAASALVLDYVLNVAVAVSAGVGALISAFPSLLPHTLALCLGVLGLITLLNLRGVRETGRAFLVPTYLFVLCLGVAIVAGIVKIIATGGHPTPVVAPSQVSGATQAATAWVLLRAFSNGCTAMTGIEAVSNAVPIFRRPRVQSSQRTLTSIVFILAALLLGIALMSRMFGIGATTPGEAGYQSVLSQLVAATTGRGVFYYVTMGAVMAVLCLSANTSFAGFPRICRLMALDKMLPGQFAHQGRRLVYAHGIVVLALLAAALLVIFNGITERLIPLFAIGAFSAFTLSQAGMVIHWRRQPGRHHHAMIINAVGAGATAVTLVVVAVTKFAEGAWLSLLIMGVATAGFASTRRYYRKVDRELREDGPFRPKKREPPLVVVPLRCLDRIGRKALNLALSLSSDVYVVQVRTQDHEIEDLSSRWEKDVVGPIRESGLPEPRLVTLDSEYRELVDPLFDYLRALAERHPERRIALLVPELVERRWHNYLVQSHTASMLKMRLLHGGGPHVVLIDSPWYHRG